MARTLAARFALLNIRLFFERRRNRYEENGGRQHHSRKEEKVTRAFEFEGAIGILDESVDGRSDEIPERHAQQEERHDE